MLKHVSSDPLCEFSSTIINVYRNRFIIFKLRQISALEMCRPSLQVSVARLGTSQTARFLQSLYAREPLCP